MKVFWINRSTDIGPTLEDVVELDQAILFLLGSSQCQLQVDVQCSHRTDVSDKSGGLVVVDAGLIHSGTPPHRMTPLLTMLWAEVSILL